ncbi:UNVERIFIED_CONTAM: hypothetical protein GTU68_037513 [Idotea baltica]|nr:hypothetical protein [Idotea baltica]
MTSQGHTAPHKTNIPNHNLSTSQLHNHPIPDHNQDMRNQLDQLSTTSTGQ